MKNHIKSLAYAVCLITIFSCSDEEQLNQNSSDQDLNLQLDQELSVKESTNNLSSLFIELGVTGINVLKSKSGVLEGEDTNISDEQPNPENSETGRINYNVNTSKPFIHQMKLYDLSKFEIIYDNNYIYLKRSPTFKMSLKNGKIYLNTPTYSGYLENLTDQSVEEKVFVLSLFIHELTAPSVLKNNSNSQIREDDLKYKRGCSFANTYYVINFGISASTSKSKTELEAYELGLKGDFVKIGGIDTSCYTDSHFCFSTQAMCMVSFDTIYQIFETYESDIEISDGPVPGL